MSPSSATLTRPAPNPAAPTVRHRKRPGRPRVWLARPSQPPANPPDWPTVRDTAMRIWVPGTDGIYHSSGGWHHVSWQELRALYDLVEVA